MGTSPWKSGRSPEPGASPQAVASHAYEGELMTLACRVERILAAVEPGRSARHLRTAIEMARGVLGEVSGFAEARHGSAAVVALGAETEALRRALSELEGHLGGLARRDVEGFFLGQAVGSTAVTYADFRKIGSLTHDLLEGYFYLIAGRFPGEVERERWGQVFRGLGAEILRAW